ncbi:MAG: DUF4389 domain-containing protein [Solirubrobacterales bacterium]
MYPITYEADFNPHPSRGTTFFRYLLAIPWMIVAVFWGLLYYVTYLLALIAIVILGRYPEWLFNFNSGVIRFGARFSAWIGLQTDEWPPFGLSDDPSYPIRVNIAPAAERQSRLKALFRMVLVLPMLIVSYGISFISLGISLVAWLTIVFRGYLPEAVNSAMTYVNGFNLRLAGYTAMLTDDYPPVGLEAARSDETIPPPDTQATPPTAPTA